MVTEGSFACVDELSQGGAHRELNYAHMVTFMQECCVSSRLDFEAVAPLKVIVCPIICCEGTESLVNMT